TSGEENTGNTGASKRGEYSCLFLQISPDIAAEFALARMQKLQCSLMLQLTRTLPSPASFLARFAGRLPSP
ncbi:hypothetical protein L9F63_015144, partial [Diploptera punctata]